MRHFDQQMLPSNQRLLHALQLKVDDFESQIKELKLENAEHRDRESKIALGQVAWLFEWSLAMFVLPEEVENKYGSFDAESFMHK